MPVLGSAENGGYYGVHPSNQVLCTFYRENTGKSIGMNRNKDGVKYASTGFPTP